MAFLYDKQSQSAFDADTQTTIRIAPTFLDTYPQPFEFMTADRSFYVDYEMEEEPRRITLENGNIDMHCDVAILKLQDWHVKCEFVLHMRGHLKNPWPERPRALEALALYQAGFEEPERDGRRKEYEAWKSYLLDGVRVCWTEGQASTRLRVEFIEHFPEGLRMA